MGASSEDRSRWARLLQLTVLCRKANASAPVSGPKRISFSSGNCDRNETSAPRSTMPCNRRQKCDSASDTRDLLGCVRSNWVNLG
eukprot:2403560-Pleurochrysis_carterae.AAC.1